jgi:hypothetical protein
MKKTFGLVILSAALTSPPGARAQQARIEVRADKVLHPISPYLTGACIEDVNHEIYGGIDSQMIFGEHFAEPALAQPLQGFTAFGGRWLLKDGVVQAAAGDGPKLVSNIAPFAEGEAGVDVWFSEHKGGNAGLIVKVSKPGLGADHFNGYEIALETRGRLVLGRHRQNWEPIRNVPCDVPISQWIRLTARMTARSLEVLVNGKSVTRYEDSEHPLESGTVGLRTWQREAQFRNLTVTSSGQAPKQELRFVAQESWGDGVSGVSGMWRALRRGSADGSFQIDEQNAFCGKQSQRLTLVGGQGEIGIENQSLNRWGMNFVGGKAYQGYVWVRSQKPVELFVALESRDGATIYDEKRLEVSRNDWQRLDFRLTPDASDKAGRFALKLKKPGSIAVGYAFLQPGEWGRFKSLPVRKDVAEGLIGQGITVLRQGGSMVNAAEYRWKKMIGPRDRRPPHVGTWYPYSSNGWGIFDFLNFCEAAGFLGIPDVNMDETPQDMADFIEYANGPASSKWGSRREADGHPAPYRLKYLELGNEERVDEKYAAKFEALAKAIWAKDAEVVLVVGDFLYSQPILDPFSVRGAASRITTLAAHQRILRFAKSHNREVWFDVHVDTEGPRPNSTLAGMFSFRDALTKIADGAKHEIVVFELNANNHSQRRALANALAIQAIERDGRIPIVTSANCLQTDGQNDNGWNQGLLFLNPSQTWLQPPGYVTQLFSHNYQPHLVECRTTGPKETLDVNATKSADGRTLIVKAVNATNQAVSAEIHVAAYVPKRNTADVADISAALNAKNTAAEPNFVVSRTRQWQHGLKDGKTSYSFPARSITIIRWQ